MSRGSLLRIIALSAVALAISPAAAQTLPAVMSPETAVVGPGGVDAVSGQYRDEASDLSIGSEANGGITFTRINDRKKFTVAPFTTNWHIFLDRECKKAPGSSPTTPCTITWELKSKALSETWLEFLSQPGTYSQEGMPPIGISKLQYTASGHKYTTPDGTEILFQNRSLGDAFATTMTRKDGVVYTFSYDNGGDPSDGNGDDRLRRVTSNTGYQLILEYGGLNGTDRIAKACVFNTTSVTPPSAHTCPAGVQTVQYSYSGDRIASITDPAGKLWTIDNQFTTAPYTQTFKKPIGGVQTTWLTNTLGSMDTVTQQQYADGRAIAYSYVTFDMEVADGSGGGGGSPLARTRGTGWVENGTASTSLTWEANQLYGITDWGPLFISPAPVVVSDPLGRISGVDFFAGDYSPHGQVLSKTIIGGRKQSFTYGNFGVITQAKWSAKPGSTDADLAINYTYDCTVEFNCPKPLTVTDPRGNVTDYTYSATNGLMLTETLPADANGVRPKKTYTYGQFQARFKNSSGAFVNGASVTLLTQISECRTTASCAGTADETRTTLTYPTAATTNNLLPISKTVASGDGTLSATTSWTFDDNGNKLTEDGPLAGTADTSRSAYDSKRRVIRSMTPDPDGAGALKPLAVVNTYDDAGRLIKQENGTVPSQATDWTSFVASDSVETTYDALDRKLTEARKSGGTTFALTQYSYDSFGRLDCTAVRMNPAVFGSLPASACTLGTQGSDGPDRITKNGYDLAGQLIKVTEGFGTADQADEATYAYTPSGKREFLTDARGYTAKMVYDGHDRHTQWLFPDKVTPGLVSTADHEDYTYDNNGNRTSLRKRDGSTLTFTYDALNRMTVKTVPERAGLAATHSRDVFYAYDLQGRQLKARFDSLSGDGLTSAYDGLGRLTSTTLAMDGTSRQLSYGYDLSGFRTSLTHPDTTVFNYTPDVLGRLTGLAQGASALRGFGYDSDGRLTSGGLAAATTGLSTYGYDPIGRLNALSHNLVSTAADVAWTFSYNNASQLKQAVRDNDSYAWTGAVAGSRGYATNGLNQYTAAGAATFTYDDNGNLTGDGTSTYIYDIENRMVSGSVGGQVVSVRYDPMGRLYEVAGSTSGTTRFLYDGDELVGEFDTSGTMLKRYVHGIAVDDPVVQYEGSGLGSTAVRYLVTDRQGSVVGLTDSTGAIVSRNTYDEYGIPKSDQVGESVVGRFAYTGQIWLPELGMYHYKARLYSPTLGRFMQTDPIGYDDQVNLYAYVGNDPMNKGDPTGLYQCTGTRICPQFNAAQKIAIVQIQTAIKSLRSLAGSVSAGRPLSKTQSAVAVRVDKFLGKGFSSNAGRVSGLANAATKMLGVMRSNAPILEAAPRGAAYATTKREGPLASELHPKFLGASVLTQTETVAHEAAHKALGAEDYGNVLGAERADAFARTNPQDAINNADNIALSLGFERDDIPPK